MATPKPHRSPAEVQDIILRKIFQVSLIEPMQVASSPPMAYLEMTAAEILSEGKELLHSCDLVERVLIDRLSCQFPSADAPFQYLLDCYRRAQEELTNIQSMEDKDLRAAMEGVVKEAKKLAVSRSRIVSESLALAKSIVSLLLPIIFSEVSTAIDRFEGSIGPSAPPGFLYEFFGDSDFDTLYPILEGLYAELRDCVLGVSALGNFQQPLRALVYLVKFPNAAESLMILNDTCSIPRYLSRGRMLR